MPQLQPLSAVSQFAYTGLLIIIIIIIIIIINLSSEFQGT